MEGETLVYVDLSGTPHLVGRLWTRTRKDKESATFEYAREWLANPQCFSLEPALILGPGPFHTGDRALFGAIGDSAPDRWGRLLMRRAERHRAHRERQTPRTLQEIDFLLMVDDEALLRRFDRAQRADYFELSLNQARQIAAEVGATVSKWRKVAADMGLRATEIERMASAFDHDDLKQAIQSKKAARKR